MCIQCNCTNVKGLAEEILYKYKCNETFTDMDHPQYIAGAVYVACK